MTKVEDPVARLTVFYAGDPESLAQALREHLDRGDFLFWNRLRARWAWYAALREIRRAARHTPEGVALRQARAAEHTAFAAYSALVISLAALWVSWLAYQKP
jgi:hypothetical protein